MRLSLTSYAARLALAAVLIVAADGASADTIALSTPAGLNNGDKFRFLFVTAGTTDATSSDISTYNAFVQAQAGGATYNGVTVNWKAIATTSTVNARDNVGGFSDANPVIMPVYLPSGSLIANSLTTFGGSGMGLWSGSLGGNPNEGIDGTSFTAATWTGSYTDGTNFAGLPLGSAFPLQGITNSSSVTWIFASTTTNTTLRSMYGVSEELTVGGSTPVPEIDPAGMGSVLALVTGALGLVERRRSKAS